MKMTKPLNDFSTEEEWEAAAKRLGLGVPELKAQIKLADSIIEEIFKEEEDANQNEESHS